MRVQPNLPAEAHAQEAGADGMTGTRALCDVEGEGKRGQEFAKQDGLGRGSVEIDMGRGLKHGRRLRATPVRAEQVPWP